MCYILEWLDTNKIYPYISLHCANRPWKKKEKQQQNNNKNNKNYQKKTAQRITGIQSELIMIPQENKSNKI